MADLPNPVTDPARVREITESVLSRPEFLEARPTWWQQLQHAIGDLIGRLIDLVGGDGRGSVIGTVVLVALAVTAALLLLRFTRTMRRDPGVAVAVDGGIGRSPQVWSDEARDHEAAGRWRDALRCRYRALLAQLAAAGLVEEVPGRTSGEYLTQIRRDLPAAAEPFTRLTRNFEAAWYGHAPVQAHDVAEFNAAAAQVLKLAGVRATAGVAAR